MQTFLPYSDFYRCAQVLDPSRLGNQFYREGLTLIRGGWSHHPASKMWRNHFYALGKYLLACAQVLELERGLSYPQHVNEIKCLMRHQSNKCMPAWLGDEKVHASHRANLLLKGICDNTFKLYRDKGPKLKRFWTEKVYEDLWQRFGIPPPLWYGQYGWQEKPIKGYYWPV